jgi:hypothetical protein
VSGQASDEDSAADKKAFGCLTDLFGCGAEGCFIFALPCVLGVLFIR